MHIAMAIPDAPARSFPAMTPFDCRAKAIMNDSYRVWP